jgi:hypothetical protein
MVKDAIPVPSDFRKELMQAEIGSNVTLFLAEGSELSGILIDGANYYPGHPFEEQPDYQLANSGRIIRVLGGTEGDYAISILPDNSLRKGSLMGPGREIFWMDFPNQKLPEVTSVFISKHR